MGMGRLEVNNFCQIQQKFLSIPTEITVGSDRNSCHLSDPTELIVGSDRNFCQIWQKSEAWIYVVFVVGLTCTPHYMHLLHDDILPTRLAQRGSAATVVDMSLELIRKLSQLAKVAHIRAGTWWGLLSDLKIREIPDITEILKQITRVLYI